MKGAMEGLNFSENDKISYDEFEGIYKPEEIKRDKNRVLGIKVRNNAQLQARERWGSYYGVENEENASGIEFDVAEMITGEDLFGEYDEEEPLIMDDGSEKGIAKKKLCLLMELTQQSSGMLRDFAKAYPGIRGIDLQKGARSGAPRDIQVAYNNIAVLERYFGRALRFFKRELKVRSAEKGETQRDEYFGDPDGFYDSVMSILRTREDMSFQKIREMGEEFYGVTGVA